ncbi:toxin subunit protein [Botrytis cinerea]
MLQVILFFSVFVATFVQPWKEGLDVVSVYSGKLNSQSLKRNALRPVDTGFRSTNFSLNDFPKLNSAHKPNHVADLYRSHWQEYSQRRSYAEVDRCRYQSARRSQGAIDAFLGKWTVPFNVIVYLSFIKTLLIYTNDDEEICGAFLTILPDATPEDLAKELFPQDKLDTLLASDSNTLPDNLTANDVNQVRARFLADQPLVIILVMIRDDGDFTLEDRPRTIIVLILELMVKRQAKLGSAELVSMLKENFPQDDSPLNDKEITSASTFVRCVKTLSYLVEDPLDIPRLYDSKYHSIRSITSKSKNDFKSDLHSAGASTANALKIHDCAERVDCWNEQLWLALMKAGKADVADSMIPQPEDDDTDSTNDTVKPTRPLASLSGPPESWNNLTDIFRLENVACEECCSITSMSAYFADLLNLLSNTTPTGGTKATTNDASASSDSGTNSTLLDLLSARRPDLTKLELSCANSQTLIPNINLVNEVLESFIRYKSQSLLSESASDDQDCILVFNTPADASDDCVQDGHSDGPVYRPGNTDFEVYSKVVSQQMYPFTCFPYDYAWSSVKEYFNIFQIPYTQLIEVFQAPELLFEKITQVARDKLSEEQRIGLLRGSAEVLKRQNAASVLNLHQKEFAAIAGETFFPAWFAAWLEGLASDIVPIATGPPEESTNELGLTYIKQQLMKRSGLDFPDILDLVKTQLFGKDLVIINKTGSKEFSTFIDDLRLLANASEPPFQSLNTTICRDLQSFLRLKAKLGWSTRDLDAAIYCLRNNEMALSPDFKGTTAPNTRPISVYVLNGIASIVRLSNLCGIEPAALLPLWGPIDAFGKDSFLYRKFLRPSLGKVFAIPKDGEEFFEPGGTKFQIYACGTSVCASLNWPFQYLRDLLEATGYSDSHLTVGTLSKLYRYTTISQILSVPATKCAQFFKLFFDEAKENPLSSPEVTFEVLDMWKKLLNSNWTIESLLDVFETAQLEDVQDSSGLQLTRAILEGTVDLKKSLSSISTVDIPTSETVVDCVGRTFDATTASTILGFIEGTQILTGYATLSNKAALDSLVSLAKDWPNKVSVIPSIEGKIYSAQIKLCGILTSSEKTKILDGSKDFPAINAALVTLVATSLFPQNIIKSRFENNPDSSGKLQNNVLLDDWEEPPSESSDSSSLNASSIAAENYLRNRRAAFIDLAKPTIIQDLLTSLILNSTKDQIIDVDVSIIASLVSDVVKVPTKDNSGLESATTALQSLSVPIESSIQVNLDAYFTPTTTDDYTIHYTGTSTNPEITINGLKMPYDSSANTWSQFRMISGQAYLLQADFDSSQVSWSTCRSMPTLFTDEELLLSATVQRTTSVLEAIRKVALICQTLKLTTTEIAFFNRQVQLKFEMLAIDLNSPSLKDLVQLQGYCALRDTCIPSTKDDNLMSLFSWLSSSTDADASSIVTKIGASTGWNNTLVESALDQKYPNYTAGNLMTTLRNYDNFSGLNAIVQFYDSLGGVSDINSMPPIAELFNLARPAQQLDNADSYVQAAQDLQNRLTAAQQENFDDGLMQTQRAALVNYLLQQDYIKDLNIWDADGLFEYFLVDVQIGPQLRTSRIKQAISVVQLYTQRCLLGLEEDVAMTDVRRDKWDWMQQYTLWEANRKLFLYPENWIDPMLRDDKSQLFDQFEAALLQKDLSIDTFLHAIQNYVYGLNEISKLDIVAYVHEPEFKEADIFHFFGRTRTAPYSFYYRTVTILATSEIFWQPWTKIDMDIPSIETEWEGHRLDNVGSYLLPEIIGGRLYLFMPSIMPKSLATNIGDNLKGVATFDDLRGQSPNIAAPERVWEISMGWTELIRGSWAPKRVSAGTLTVGLAASASQFRVEPTFDDNKMTMKINYSTIGNTDFNEIGSFIFFNDQISTISSDSTTSVSGNFPTYFQKVLGKGIKQVALSIDPPDPDKPLIWVPHDLTSYNQNDLTWTLSKTQQRVTALVVTTIDSDGMSLSRFNMPRTELTPTDGHQWTSQRVIDDMELVQLDHSFSHELMEHTTDRVDPLGNLYNNLAKTPADQLKERYGAGSQNASYHELGRPTAIYNWEIGIHAVYLAVDRLSTTQQYDEALQIARLVFDPSVSVQVDRSDGEKTISTKTCWKFPPFQDMACMMANKGESSFDPLDLANLKKEIELAIKERRSYGALVHAAARGRPVSYMKWIVMKYAEILIALGDIQFRRGTSECLPLATQRYIEAARVLGPEPPNVPDLGNRKSKVLTYAQLRVKDNAFDEVSLDLGLPFSFNIVPKGNATVSSTDPRMENITCVLKTDYFSIPLNPKFKTMRSLVQERLFNIRNSFDIQGKPVVYALRDPPIDPGDLVALGKQGLSISDVLSMISGERDGPLTNQRFATLMGAALNLCTEIPKIPKPGDDWTDVPQNIDVQSSDELRMSPYEKLQMTMSLSSYSKNSQATVTDAVALPLYLLPTIQGDFEPLGVGTSISAGGTQYAEFVAAGSALLRGFAALDASQADQADKKASLTAQLQDRRFQANISGRQIKSIDKQIEIQQIQIKSIQKDLDMQKSQLDEAVQAETWYRSKYTNEQLYSWMEKRLRNLYLQAYNLVLDAALQAQSAFSFEAGRKCSIIKPAGYWDASRNGLLAAQDLFWDLKKLEATQAGNNSADYNITKTVSLKEINPMALMNFRIAGTCDFSLDELLFDMDFPGHYMRRIRSVAVSIPATFETNCSANAILTLLSHKYRVTQSAADYVASQAASSESFRTDRIPTSSIAVSNGDADSGVFELDFSGSQYMPFEGAGAISKWRLELHHRPGLSATSPSLHAAANQATLQVMKATGAEGQQQGFSAIFDLKHEFSDDWKSFGDQLASQTADSNDTPSMKLGDLKKKLPYWSQRQDALKVQNITFITHSQELRDRLDIQSSTGDRTWNGSKIGDYYVKSSTTCSDTSLNWIIQGGTSPTKWDKKNFENAFLLIQYVFTGTEIV